MQGGAEGTGQDTAVCSRLPLSQLVFTATPVPAGEREPPSAGKEGRPWGPRS